VLERKDEKEEGKEKMIKDEIISEDKITKRAKYLAKVPCSFNMNIKHRHSLL
jgi:hypothetical protein